MAERQRSRSDWPKVSRTQAVLQILLKKYGDEKITPENVDTYPELKKLSPFEKETFIKLHKELEIKTHELAIIRHERQKLAANIHTAKRGAIKKASAVLETNYKEAPLEDKLEAIMIMLNEKISQEALVTASATTPSPLETIEVEFFKTRMSILKEYVWLNSQIRDLRQKIVSDLHKKDASKSVSNEAMRTIEIARKAIRKSEDGLKLVSIQ